MKTELHGAMEILDNITWQWGGQWDWRQCQSSSLRKRVMSQEREDHSTTADL